MLRKLALLLALLAPAIHAQTVVSGTVADTQGFAYSSARLTITFTPSFGPPVQLPAIALTPTGTFTTVILPPSAGTYSFSAAFGGIAPPIGTGPQTCTTSNVTITGMSQTVTFTCVSLTNITGGGGGGGTPAGPPAAIQLDSDAGNVFATANQSGFYFGLDSQATPTRLNIPFSYCQSGPRPSVDVTCYGAKGNNSADDTSAIQAALTASCAATGTGGTKPSVFFPPGVYRAAIPQTGSSATSVFTMSCPLSLVFAEGTTTQGAQFPTGGAAIIPIVGSNPLDVPLFLWTTANSNTSVHGGVIEGYKKAIQITSGANFQFEDGVASTVSTTPTLASGDCPITLSDTLFDSFINYPTQVQSNTAYGHCWIDTAPTQPVGVISIDNEGHPSSGCLVYYQPVTNITNSIGTWTINHSPVENCSGLGVVQIANPGSFATTFIGNLHFEDDLGSDSTLNAQAFLYTVIGVSGVTISHVFAGANSQGSAILGPPGLIIQDYREECGGCTSQVVDTSGNLIGNGKFSSVDGGTYHVSAVTSPSPNTGKCRSDFNTGKSQWNTPSDSWFAAGGKYANIDIDANCGLQFGTGNGYGFDGGTFKALSQGQVGFFPMLVLPPTAATAASGSAGGTLGAGTYTYDVRTTTTSSCATATTSAPSLTTSPVTITSGTQINVSWTLPANGSGTETGYCIQRNPGFFVGGYIYVAGATTASYTDSGTAMTGTAALPYVNPVSANPTQIFGIGSVIPCQQPAIGAGIATVHNNCVAAAIAVKGTADGRNWPYSVNIDATLNQGDSGGDPVTILYPPTCLWIPIITNGTDAVQWWGGANVIVQSADGYSSCYIEQALSTFGGNPVSIAHLMLGQGVAGVNTFGKNNNIKYYVAPTGAATTSGIGVLIENFQDEASFNGSSVIDQVDPIGAEFLNNCCNFQLDGSFFGANNASGVTPLVFANTTGQSQQIHMGTINADAPGAGFPNIKCSDTFQQSSVYIIDALYEEGSTTDTNTTMNQIAGCGIWKVGGGAVKHLSSGSTAADFSFSNSGSGAWDIGPIGSFNGAGTSHISIIDSNGRTCPGAPTTPCNYYTRANFLDHSSSKYNCTSSASPAVCANNEQGAVVIASGAASVVVNTTDAPNNTGEISLTFDTTLGTRLGVTCNTTAQQPYISAVTPQTSFTISVPSNFSTNPGCFTYRIRK